MAITVMIGSKHSAMGSTISLMTAGDNIGLTLGPMICGAVAEIADYETAFAGITLLMVGATLFIRCFGAAESKLR
jgi:hypothetical protein